MLVRVRARAIYILYIYLQRSLASFISYMVYKSMPLHLAAGEGHEAVTKQLIAARCDVDLRRSMCPHKNIHTFFFCGHRSLASFIGCNSI